MRLPIYESLLLLPIVAVVASEGDQLPEYKSCVRSCDLHLKCEGYFNPGAIRANARPIPGEDIDVTTPSSPYTLDDFANNYEVGIIPKTLFNWDCHSNCKYKCIRFVTQSRFDNGYNVVQFDGKWPFFRVFGFTELFSVIFSLANLYANYVNLRKIHFQYSRNKRESLKESNAGTIKAGYHVMYRQYLILLVVACFGWIFSTIFHIRDTALTETMDYFGAIAIIMCNFNVIFIRYFELFAPKNSVKLYVFQICMVVAYVFHLTKLLNFWDYAYNVKFNLVFGVGSLVLWTLHSLNTQNIYLRNFHIYNNSIQLLPYETKILSKLEFTVLFSQSRLIPLIPIFLNLVLMFGMSLELIDFVPFALLIDAHSLWHLVTVFPTLIWFDWNIWDLELLRISNDVGKFN